MFAIPPVGSWSLKTKLALCSGALIFVCLAAFTSGALRAAHQDLVHSVTDAQHALARSTADDIDEKILSRSAALAKTADALSATVDGQQSTARLDAFFDAQPVMRDLFDGIVIVDTTGHFAYDTERGSGRVGKKVERAYIRRVLNGAPSAMSSPFRATTGSKPLLVVFAAPLHGADGKVSGALMGSIDLLRPNFLGRLVKARIGEAGRFTLIEKSVPPTIVIHNDARRILSTIDPSKDPNLARGLAGFEGTVEGNSGGVEALRTSVSLRAAPWMLVAVYPTAEAFAEGRVRQRETLWVAFALCLLASLSAWLMAGWMLQPLKRLQGLMAQHGSERGALIPAASFGSDELATLVSVYNAQTVRRREFEDRLKASERHMRDITDAIPAEIAHIDLEGRYTFANVRTEVVFGQRPGGLVGLPVRAVRESSAPYAEIEAHVARVLRGEPVSFEGTQVTQGETRHYQASYHPDRDEDGQVCGYYSMQFDITPLKEAQARQARVEERLRAITDNLPVLISYIDPDERYVFLNATFRSWYGLDPVATVGRTLREVLSADSYAHRHDYVRRCLAGEHVSFDYSRELLSGEAHLHAEYVPDLTADGRVVGCYTITTDVTALKNVERQLAQLVRSDNLTGLPNRYQFNETLPLALARCTRSGLAMAVMFLDIDHFKMINDELGHATGDAVLQEFAARLQRGVRSTDLAARLGGDEFVVVLEGLHSDAEAQRVARNILADIDRPFTIEGRSLTITTSVGIAYQATAEATAPELLAMADGALYQAKAAGRNTYRLAAA